MRVGANAKCRHKVQNGVRNAKGEVFPSAKLNDGPVDDNNELLEEMKIEGPTETDNSAALEIGFNQTADLPRNERHQRCINTKVLVQGKLVHERALK